MKSGKSQKFSKTSQKPQKNKEKHEKITKNHKKKIFEENTKKIQKMLKNKF